MLNLEDRPLTWPQCSLDPMAVQSTSFSLWGFNWPPFWSSANCNIFAATASVSGWSNFGFPSTIFGFLVWSHCQARSSKPSEGSSCRQLLPPLFHGSTTGRPSFCTHLTQGGLYVCFSVLDVVASGLRLEFLQWSFVEQALPIVLVWCPLNLQMALDSSGYSVGSSGHNALLDL